MSFEWLNKNSRKFLINGYLSEGETPEGRVRDIAEHAEKLLGIEGFADKFYSYASKGWYSFSSPVWGNYGKERGLPVSCFGSWIGDSIGEILYAQSEVGMMSKMGGGTSGYFGDIRPRGSQITDNGKTSGSVHFMELFDKITDVISQGNMRRGRMAPYLPVEHADIEEFLQVGTEGHPIQSMTTGVTVTDAWLQDMIDGDLEKRQVWAKVLQSRSEIGYPYVMFKDNANRNKPDVYQDKGMEIVASNLCTEIMLPERADESFVCVLSSINALHYDEWKDTDAVETMIYFLDTVVTELLNKLEAYRDSEDGEDQIVFEFMKRAYRFAKRHRALGAGILGLHSLYQSRMLPFDSKEAAKLNYEVFRTLNEKSYAASRELATKFGEPEVLEGYGRRNTTLNAVAPTTSSSFILGQVSQSIEPFMSNYYIKDLAKLKAEIKNPFLEKILEEKGNNITEIWQSIAERDGSVQHLDFLTDHEKEVFRTFKEINPTAILNQAGVRQEYLDQTQSLNLMISSDYSVKEINQLMILAWALGLPTLYYQHSVNAAQDFARSRLMECKACEA